MRGVDIAVGYLAVYAWRKARRVAGRADEIMDEGLEAGLERLQALVEDRLGADDRVLKKLQVQAGADLDRIAVTSRTRERVRLALEDEAEVDPGFGAELREVVDRLQAAGRHPDRRGGGVWGQGGRGRWGQQRDHPDR